MSRYKIPRAKKDLVIPDFIEIEDFHTSLQNFHAALKPRADLDSEVMTLYLKTFNLEQLYNKKKPKKFAFSVFMGSQLAMDPDLFDHKNCEREFRKACENNHISKSNLNKHWAVVVVNLLHKQFNVFDSVKNATDVNLLHKATNNVLMIFACFIILFLSFFFKPVCFKENNPYFRSF
uniref:Ubiquitin-like protease family profile domain-containing protein n=1 Tax=Triticum urartu TaxID=4572 RepID=A0A8R7PIS7_TRIUA